MNSDEAEKFLTECTPSTNGVFTRLRVGHLVDRCSIERMIIAIRSLESVHTTNSIPKNIVKICAIIIHFSDQCRRNLIRWTDDDQLVELVDKLEQCAFNFLADNCE